MLMHMHFFGVIAKRGEPAEYREPCEKAYQDFLRWTRANKITSSQRKFVYWTIFRDEYGTFMNCKGYNARVVSAWLEHVLERATWTPPAGMLADGRLSTCLATLNPSSNQE